jgi:hypothetical protein
MQQRTAIGYLWTSFRNKPLNSPREKKNTPRILSPALNLRRPFCTILFSFFPVWKEEFLLGI